MSSRCTFLIALILLSAVGVLTGGSGTERDTLSDKDQIIFLHLHADSSGITLVEMNTVNGSLKTRRDSSISGTLYYEVESADGSVIYSGSLSDPLRKRYEYEDPEYHGRIKTKIVLLPDVDFELRIPKKNEIERISFYKFEPATGKAEIVKKDMIGRIKISLDNEVNR